MSSQNPAQLLIEKETATCNERIYSQAKQLIQNEVNKVAKVAPELESVGFINGSFMLFLHEGRVISNPTGTEDLPPVYDDLVDMSWAVVDYLSGEKFEPVVWRQYNGAYVKVGMRITCRQAQTSQDTSKPMECSVMRITSRTVHLEMPSGSKKVFDRYSGYPYRSAKTTLPECLLKIEQMAEA